MEEDLLRRLAALERKVAHTRRRNFGLAAAALIALCGLALSDASWLPGLAAVFLFGSVVSGRRSDEDVVRAQRFELVDRRGTVVSVLQIGAHGPSLAMFDGRNEAPVCSFGQGDRGPGLFLRDRRGKLRAQLVSDYDGPYLAMYDSSGTIRLGLAVPGDGPALDLYDPMGEARAAIFAHTSHSGIVFRDRKGKIVHSAPEPVRE